MQVECLLEKAVVDGTERSRGEVFDLSPTSSKDFFFLLDKGIIKLVGVDTSVDAVSNKRVLLKNKKGVN